MERPDGMPNIVSLEVMCGKDHMDVHLTFSHPFEGIVSSKGESPSYGNVAYNPLTYPLYHYPQKGQHSDPRCVYVPPSTGKTFFSFRISYSRCGTKPDLNGQFYENTVGGSSCRSIRWMSSEYPNSLLMPGGGSVRQGSAGSLGWG